MGENPKSREIYQGNVTVEVQDESTMRGANPAGQESVRNPKNVAGANWIDVKNVG